MSKMNELSQQQVATTSAQPPALPTDVAAELELFRKAARANTKAFLMGSALLFKKGAWLLGSDKTKIPDGTKYIALMNLASEGYLRWNEDKTATHRDVGKIAEGWVLPDKETLPDRDPEKWPIGLNGRKEDPWRRCCYLPLVTLDGETIATFATNTSTGVSAFWKFVERYAWLGRKHLGKFPVIQIEASGYEDKRYGWVDTPSFKIVDWTSRPDVQKLIGEDGGGDSVDVAKAEPPLRDDMDDEIPWL
jgi:hypothetical protein